MPAPGYEKLPDDTPLQQVSMADRMKKMGMANSAAAKGFCTEFKEFLNRGNVVDMAVGIVVGGAFTAVVTSLVNDMFSPILGLMGQASLDQLFVVLRYKNATKAHFNTIENAKDNGAITLNYGRFIQAILSFVIISLFMFLVVRLIYKIYKPEVPAVPPSTDWPCPKCQELVKETATRCPHCTAEPIKKPPPTDETEENLQTQT